MQNKSDIVTHLILQAKTAKRTFDRFLRLVLGLELNEPISARIPGGFHRIAHNFSIFRKEIVQILITVRSGQVRHVEIGIGVQRFAVVVALSGGGHGSGSGGFTSNDAGLGLMLRRGTVHGGFLIEKCLGEGRGG